MSSIVYSFCDYSVLSPPQLDRAPELRRPVRTTRCSGSRSETRSIYAALALPLGLFVALFFALLLDAKLRGSSIYRTLSFLPALMPVVASAIIWLWMLNGEFGVINHFLNKLTFGVSRKSPGSRSAATRCRRSCW